MTSNKEKYQLWENTLINYKWITAPSDHLEQENKEKGKIKPIYERKPNMNLNYFVKDVELITCCLEVSEEQVNHHIDRNVNEVTIFLLKSQLFNEN